MPKSAVVTGVQGERCWKDAPEARGAHNDARNRQHSGRPSSTAQTPMGWAPLCRQVPANAPCKFTEAEWVFCPTRILLRFAKTSWAVGEDSTCSPSGALSKTHGSPRGCLVHRPHKEFARTQPTEEHLTPVRSSEDLARRSGRTEQAHARVGQIVQATRRERGADRQIHRASPKCGHATQVERDADRCHQSDDDPAPRTIDMNRAQVPRGLAEPLDVAARGLAQHKATFDETNNERNHRPECDEFWCHRSPGGPEQATRAQRAQHDAAEEPQCKS